ncbi:MAG: 2-C-methyl-D-erythritol 4-phosphate cytidylyltransferase [Chromatiaceae bacterium]
MSRSAHFWAVLPAAGVGRRVGGVVPKQYLTLGGRPVIEYPLQLFLTHPRIAGVAVALDAADAYWAGTAFAEHPKIMRVAGGAERCHSVLNALDALVVSAAESDWVLVHDAARPCLRGEDLDRLLALLESHPVGGLLGVPVRDTMKQVGPDGEVRHTVPRDDLWHAFTPQMFRLGLLRRALHAAIGAGRVVTDDASAVELLGLEPLLVEGRADNIKVTSREDLVLAHFYLQQQGRLC